MSSPSPARSERTVGWWHRWLRCRTIEEYRAYHGRRGQRSYTSIDQRSLETDRPAGDYLLPPVSFEDELVDLMDFQRALPFLSPTQQRVLALTAAGFNDIEIGVRLGKAQGTVACQKCLARRILRAACAVVV